METGIFINGLSATDLRNLILECLKEHSPNSATENILEDTDLLLTRREAAKFLHISLPTLAERTQDTTLTSYRIGSRILYKKSELESALKERSFKKLRN